MYFTKETITKEKFAEWSCERDYYVGSESIPWHRLKDDEKQAYIKEAEMYMSGGNGDDWPLDILKRFEKPELQDLPISAWPKEIKEEVL